MIDIEIFNYSGNNWPKNTTIKNAIKRKKKNTSLYCSMMICKNVC